MPDTLTDRTSTFDIDWAERAESQEVEPERDAESADITKPWDPALIRVDQRPFSVSQVIDMIDHGDLELQPEFQRRRVWNLEQKCLLIESLLLRIPLPAFYFASDEEGHLQVIDGLQRLSTIYDFVKGSPGRRFRLSKLEYLTDLLDKKGFDDIRGQVWGRRILQSTLVGNVVDPQTPVAVKFNIFARLNKQGTPLSQQELRHAMSGARSRGFLSKLASSNTFARATDGAVVDSRRMHDAEMVLRFCAFQLTHYSDYKDHGSLSDFLTDATSKLDNSGVVPDKKLAELEERFEHAMCSAYDAFGRDGFRKYDLTMPTSPRTPLNKPLFDVWSWIFSILPRRLVSEAPDKFCKVHHDLLGDPDFVSSISFNTGTARSVEDRFKRSVQALGEIGVNVGI